MLSIVILAAGLGTYFLIRQYQNAARAHCAFNLKRLGEGIRNFHDVNNKRLPPARIADGYATWVVLIAKYMPKEDPAAADHPLQAWDVSRPFAEQASEVRQARLAEMHCPSYPRKGPLSVQGDVDAEDNLLAGSVGDYACVSGDGWTDGIGPNDNGPMTLGEVLEKKDGRILQWRGRYSFDDLQRGTIATLLLGEKHVPFSTMGWAQRGDGCVYNGQHPASSARVAGVGFGLRTPPAALLPRNFGGYHENLCQFLMADLSLNPLSLNVNDSLLGELATRK